MADVRLENVRKVYHAKGQADVTGVLDFSLQIRDGELLALLGPSGCGKSSTLRMIVGLEEISAGSIYIGGRRVNDLPPKDRDVALAFESYALYPPLTVRENISFCLRAKKVAPAEVTRRVDRVAEIMRISDLLDRKPRELGGGQKQRVSLARALVREPAVLLMDEPLSHLDAALRAQMRVELKHLQQELHMTTVLVTHDQLEAIAMSDRIAVMSAGRLQQVDTPKEIYERPANKFVADFVGEPPINFLECNVTARGDAHELSPKDGSFALPLRGQLRERALSAKTNAVIMGFRPLDVGFSTAARSNGKVELPGRVYAFESLGEEGQLAVRLGDQVALVVTPPTVSLAEDQPVWLQIDPERIHLFDATTEQAL